MEFTFPTYVLDLRDNRNRSIIESATPHRPIRVLVRPEDNASALPIPATGTLSEDSKVFHVVVVTPAGRQFHEWEWGALQDAVHAYRGS